nr:hypothetical protein [Tanacetum cinerariifolium]
AGRAALRQAWRKQDVVDAQAAVAAEGHLAVVPPAVLLFRLVEQAEGVAEAQAVQRQQRLALGHRAVDLASPYFRIVDVAVFRR